MIKFLIGLMVGGFIAYTICALMTVSKITDIQSENEKEKSDENQNN